MIHGFPALIWFFPLCAMEISGYESLAVVWFSPLLVLIGPLRRAMATPLGLLVLRLLSLVGVASYQAPTLLSRLILLAVGNFFCGLVLASKWWNMSKLDRLVGIYYYNTCAITLAFPTIIIDQAHRVVLYRKRT